MSNPAHSPPSSRTPPPGAGAHANRLSYQRTPAGERSRHTAWAAIIACAAIGCAWVALFDEARRIALDRALGASICGAASLVDAAFDGDGGRALAVAMRTSIEMSVAMMLPAAGRDLWSWSTAASKRRRPGSVIAPIVSIVQWLVGFTAVWSVASMGLMTSQALLAWAVASSARTDAVDRIVAGVTLALVAIDRLSRSAANSHTSRACDISLDRTTPHVAPLTAGGQTGTRCVRTCWGWMAITLAAGWMTLPGMAWMTLAMTLDRGARNDRLSRWIASSIVACATCSVFGGPVLQRFS